LSEAAPLEIVQPRHSCGPFRAAIFDFDGTLSLLRRNWQDVMIPMMVDILAATGTSETSQQLYAHVEEYVMRLNGKQTIFQMMRLAEEVSARGGKPLEPLAYKHQYHDLLWREVGARVELARSSAAAAEEMTVPGSRQFLTLLRDAGVSLYLASGTDLKYVRDELAVLGLDEFFGSQVYGALDDYKKFSKAMIVEQIIRDTGVAGSELIGVGDGYVEIEEVKRVGGLALGVASNENTRTGINVWKRNRLVQAGADVIVGDYLRLEELRSLLQLV
jgi:phosphoglycolate phosphatase-like HAD superfamily hydrolase